MNTDRLFNIIEMDFNSDKLKLEEEIERVINSDMNTHKKVLKIKTLLNKLSLVDMNIQNFNKMVNNENKK